MHAQGLSIVDSKYFMLKIFRAQKFIVFKFRGWSQPRKLNMYHTLYVILRTSTVGTATHRSLEKERDKLILLETVLQIHSLNQFSDIDRTSDHTVTEGCGKINTTIVYHLSMTGIVKFRKRTTDD